MRVWVLNFIQLLIQKEQQLETWRNNFLAFFMKMANMATKTNNNEIKGDETSMEIASVEVKLLNPSNLQSAVKRGG
jgi:hypothetical protein